MFTIVLIVVHTCAGIVVAVFHDGNLTKGLALCVLRRRFIDLDQDDATATETLDITSFTRFR